MTARRAVLHLGMNKTGSTAIQAVFAGYRDERIEMLGLGAVNHSGILTRAFSDRAHARHFKTEDAGRWDGLRDEARARVRAALEATARSVILSGEALSGFKHEASARDLVAFLAPHVARIDALAYVRPPEGYARGAFQQRLRSRLRRLNPLGLVPRYRAQVAPWTAALGREPELVLFHRDVVGPDVVTDFAARLGLDPAWAAGRPHRFNESLSAEATALLFLWRQAAGEAPLAGAGVRANARLVELLGRFGRRRFAFAPALMAPALAERRADIAWMEQRLGRPFPPDEPGAPGDAVVWGSEADILAMAGGLGPDLAAFLDARGLPAAGGDALALLRGVWGHLLAVPEGAR